VLVRAVEFWLMVTPLTVKEVSAVDPPAAPKDAVPVPAVIAIVCAPSIVLEKVIFAPPPAEVFDVTAARRFTAPVIEIAPFAVVVWLPERLMVVPVYAILPVLVRAVEFWLMVAPLTVREVRGVVPPIAGNETVPTPALIANG